MLSNPNGRFLPVALVDDDPLKARLKVNGVRVAGTVDDLAAVALRHQARSVLLAIPSGDNQLVQRLDAVCTVAELELFVLLPVEQVFGEPEVSDIRPVTEEDLLGRHQADLDTDAVAHSITGKRVLVTGAGGNIDSEVPDSVLDPAPSLGTGGNGSHPAPAAENGQAADARHALLWLRRDDMVLDLSAFEPGVYLRAVVAAPIPLRPRRQRLAKRAFDVSVAGVALVLLSPLLLVLTVLVRITSPGPALFAQERVGRSGRLFRCYKFRSMYADAEDRLDDLLTHDPALRDQWLSDHKLKDDPRIPPIGRFLRRTNLDELPQLWNVLRGEMSIVGPRPVVPPETIRYGDAMADVLTVKPGITGLWQVSGRNDLPYPERVQLDLAYARTHNLWGDMVICFRTIALSLRGSNGAY
jgi:exopolysaccharide production protein ExoY